jgi:microcystin-dependent protein
MLFVQTSAPTGWVKSTAHNNKSLRVVSGTAGSGGSVAFTTAFANQAVSGTNGAIGDTTLTIAQIPSHTHTYVALSGSNFSSFDAPGGDYQLGDDNTGARGGGGSHTHTASAFTGTAINLAVQYVDVIICTKS